TLAATARRCPCRRSLERRRPPTPCARARPWIEARRRTRRRSRRPWYERAVTVGARGILLVLIAAVLVIAGISIASDVGDVRDRLGGFGWWAFAAALGL